MISLDEKWNQTKYGEKKISQKILGTKMVCSVLLSFNNGHKIFFMEVKKRMG